MENIMVPPAQTHLIETDSLTAWLDEDGVVILLAKGHQTLEHAKQNMQAVTDLTNGIPIFLLLDYTKIQSVSKEARLLYSSKENAEFLKGIAILSNSLIGRLIANFDMALNNDVAPVRFFKNADEAKKWLKQLADNNA